jgi:hypothetical protein
MSWSAETVPNGIPGATRPEVPAAELELLREQVVSPETGVQRVAGDPVAPGVDQLRTRLIGRVVPAGQPVVQLVEADAGGPFRIERRPLLEVLVVQPRHLARHVLRHRHPGKHEQEDHPTARHRSHPTTRPAACQRDRSRTGSGPA